MADVDIPSSAFAPSLALEAPSDCEGKSIGTRCKHSKYCFPDWRAARTNFTQWCRTGKGPVLAYENCRDFNLLVFPGADYVERYFYHARTFQLIRIDGYGGGASACFGAAAAVSAAELEACSALDCSDVAK